jgi:hypothetical protein
MAGTTVSAGSAVVLRAMVRLTLNKLHGLALTKSDARASVQRPGR